MACVVDWQTIGLYGCHMMLSSAVLFSEMVPEESWEQDFNDWYDREHISLRMKVPGFRSAQRYCIPDQRHYLAVYEMDSLAVLKTPAYQAIKNSPSERTQRMLSNVSGFTRYLAEPIGTGERTSCADDPLDARYLYTVFFKVPSDRQAE